MRARSAGERSRARDSPPRRPNARASAEGFMSELYLALSIVRKVASRDEARHVDLAASVWHQPYGATDYVAQQISLR